MLKSVHAVGNLERLGLLSKLGIYPFLIKWKRYQKALKVLLTEHDVNQFSIINNEINHNKRFFITAHFGLYPLIAHQLSKIFPSKKVICIVGKQNDLTPLKSLAETLSVDLEFIEVGFSLIFFRKIIKLNKTGCIFLSLIDIPIGISDKSNHEVTLGNGTAVVKTGLLKIAEKLKLEPEFLIATELNDLSEVSIKSYCGRSIEEIFNAFNEELLAAPHLWDKIIDLHYFYKSNMEKDIYLPFKLERKHYIYNVSNRKVIHINSPLYLAINKIKNLKNSPELIIKERDNLYEQTGIYIGKVL